MKSIMFLFRSVALPVLAVSVALGALTAEANSDEASYARPGFVTQLHKGRLWVFRAGSKELEEFQAKGEPAKQIVRPKAGPGGITLKGADAETLDEYALAKPGFFVRLHKERLWVFEDGSKELEEFQAKGEPAKQIVRPKAGPGGITLKGPSVEVLNAYLAQP